MTDKTPTGMSVLFVNHSMAMGGIETLIVDFASRLRRDGLSPRVAVFKSGGSLERRLSELGVPVDHLNKREGVDMRMVARLRGLIQRERIDALHSNNFSTWLYT